jgi:amino acid transporter
MFDRFKRGSDAPAGATSATAATTVADRPVARGRDGAAHRDPRPLHGDGNGVTTRGATAPAVTTEHMRDVRARQRAEYGGINWGAAFFGWLVAVGLGAILVGLVAGAGAAIGLTQLSGSSARSNADTIGLGGGIALLAVLMIAYYAGGYVAGRMSRFDGARQGAGAWLLGVLVTIALGVLAAVAGDNYNVLSQLNLPRIPIGQETLTTAGIIATLAVLVGTLLAAVLGGKVGERYHRKIDRAGVVA